QFRIFTAELIFCWAFDRYVHDQTPEEVADRENKAVAVIVRAKGLDVAQAALVRADVREMMTDHRRWYYQLRDRHLMVDLFPNNATRFPLSFEDCIKKPQPPAA